MPPQIGDAFGAETPQMRPIWNPGAEGRTRVKAGIRYVTLIDNIFQGIFTKISFECAVKRMRAKRKRYRQSEIVEQRSNKSATYGKAFRHTLQQIDLALLTREMRKGAGLTQAEFAKKVCTMQPVIARLEDAEYAGHSLRMLERIATVCGVGLKLRAEKKPNFDREVALV